jgi:hypothetical protein
MNIPLPLDEQGWSQVAVCRTPPELVELLGSLLIETEQAQAVTVDDWAKFRHACHHKLPAAHAEWIDTVPFLEVRKEALRQLREGQDRDLAALRDPELWTRRAVDGDYFVVEGDPEVALQERRRWFHVLRHRRGTADEIDATGKEAEGFDALMQEPPGGWDVHPMTWLADRGRDGVRGKQWYEPRYEPQPKEPERDKGKFARKGGPGRA